MSFGDKETNEDFYFFKIRKRDYVLFRRYNRYLRNQLKGNPKLLKYLGKINELLMPDGFEKNKEQERKINELTIKVVRYFREDGEYYFKPDKESNISFDSMIHEVVSSLVFFEEIGILEKDRDEWIRSAYNCFKVYAERNQLNPHQQISNYGYKAIACYIAIKEGYSISSKKITNTILFQATRNAFKPKKSDKKKNKTKK